MITTPMIHLAQINMSRIESNLMAEQLFNAAAFACGVGAIVPDDCGVKKLMGFVAGVPLPTVPAVLFVL